MPHQSFDQLVQSHGGNGNGHASGPTNGKALKGKDQAPTPTKPKWPWVVGGLVAAGGIAYFAFGNQTGGGTGTGGTGTNGNGGGNGNGSPAAGPAEADACKWAVTTKPKEVAGQTPATVGSFGEANWLTWAAYLKAYPKAPLSPEGEWLAAWNRMKACVEASLGQNGNNKDPMDILAEEAACVEVVKQRPTSHQNKVRPANMSDDEWFSLVGYWMAYPSGPAQPKGTAYEDAAERIATCVKAKLKQDPNPAQNAPPAGPLTADEKAAADAALMERPTSVPATVVPAPQNQRPLNVSDAKWLADVAYWRTYRAAESAWMKAGKPQAPIQVPNQQSPWSPARARIEAYIAGELAKLQAGETPAPGPLTDEEKENAEIVLFEQNSIQPGNPVPYDKRGQNQYFTEWYTNQAFWRTYRSASSSWVKAGKPLGPLKIEGPNDKWAAAWNRLNQYIIARLKDVPAAGPITAEEKTAVDQALLYNWTDVPVDVTPAPDNQKPPNISKAEWITDVAYWLVYRGTGRPWMQAGKVRAPVRVPPKDSWGSAESGGQRWRDIRARILSYAVEEAA